MVAAPSDVGEAPDTAVSVRRIEEAEDLRLTLDVAAAGFGAPTEAVAVLYTPRLLSASGVAFYLAEVDGEPGRDGRRLRHRGTRRRLQRRDAAGASPAWAWLCGRRANRRRRLHGGRSARIPAGIGDGRVRLCQARVPPGSGLELAHAARTRLTGRRHSGKHVREPHERHDLAELRRRVAQAHPAASTGGRRAEGAPARRRSPRRGSTPATSQNAVSAPLCSSSPHTRAQSPGRSARAIGPSTAKASGFGAAAAILIQTLRAGKNSSPI